MWGNVMKGRLTGVLLLAVLLLCIPAYASADDNSLYALGITTEGVTVEPDFSYDKWEYEVTVPAGTKELALDPQPSSGTARIADLSGTQIGEDGTSTVYITVEAQNGAQFTYTLNVSTAPGEAPQTEPATEAATEKVTEKVTEKPKETEPVTEDTNYVKVPRDTVDQAERTIKDLQGEIATYRDTTNLYTKIMYGLIAACVVLLFLVINLALRKRDLKNEVKEYRSLGYTSSKQPKKAGASYPQQPSGDPQRRPEGWMEVNRQQPYYDRAPLNVTPQTSSRSQQAVPQPGQGAVQQAAEQQARVQAERAAAEQQARAQAERAAAEQQARAQAERAAAEQQARAQAERAAAEQQVRAQAERAAAEQQARMQAERAAAEQQAKGQAPGSPRKKKGVEVNMIDL